MCYHYLLLHNQITAFWHLTVIDGEIDVSNFIAHVEILLHSDLGMAYFFFLYKSVRSF